MAKKTICLYFEVHQPVRLRKYQFFDIGKKHDYYDDFENRVSTQNMANSCYLPANRILLKLLKEYSTRFKVAFSIPGISLELFQKYAPEVIKSFQELAKTGCVEFVVQSYSHSLSEFIDEVEFKQQLVRNATLIKELFGQTPKTFRSTAMIYSDHIGELVAKMGYTTVLTEGAKQILGWKSPNFVYANAINPKLKLLLRNVDLCDDITLRFGNRAWDQWPLTSDKYAQWLATSVKDSDVVNLFFNYKVFGAYHKADTGIFAFWEHFPKAILSHPDIEFLTPTEATKKHLSVAPLNVPFPISWADEERDVTAWLGNEMQEEAFEDLYKVRDLVTQIDDPDLNQDFTYLQESDNLYYMCTKLFSTYGASKHHTPYSSPYEAFINYMNIVSDFLDRVDRKKEEVSSKKVAPKTVKAKATPKAVKAKTEPKAVKAKADTKAVKAKAASKVVKGR
ncbi:alpha-amylase [Bacteroidia bacterium]|nr:alpha-amylase [Bacteroidia bacterium]